MKHLKKIRNKIERKKKKLTMAKVSNYKDKNTY